MKENMKRIRTDLTFFVFLFREALFEWQKIISWSIQVRIYIYIEKFLEFYRFQSIGWERKEVGFSVNVILLTRSCSCLTGTRLNCKFMHVRVWHARYLCCLCFFLYSWRDGGFISSYLVYLRQRVFEYTVTNEECLLWNFKLVGYNCISMFFFVVNKRVV